MALAGKNLLVKVSTATGGTYTTIGQMNQASMDINGENLDITAFGDGWHKRLQGLKDASYSLSGFFMTTDASGQTALRTAFVNGTDLFAQFMIDGTTGNMFKQQVFVNNYAVSASVDGTVDLSIGMEGHDSITISTTS